MQGGEAKPARAQVFEHQIGNPSKSSCALAAIGVLDEFAESKELPRERAVVQKVWKHVQGMSGHQLERQGEEFTFSKTRAHACQYWDICRTYPSPLQ